MKRKIKSINYKKSLFIKHEDFSFSREKNDLKVCNFLELKEVCVTSFALKEPSFKTDPSAVVFRALSFSRSFNDFPTATDFYSLIFVLAINLPL